MAITPVRKIHILAHRSEKTGLVAALQRLGVMEICRSSLASGIAGEGAELKALESRLARVEEALVLLKPFFPRIPIAEKLYPSRPGYRESDLLRIVDSFDLDGFLAACEGNSRRLDDLQVGLARLEEERRQLSPWASLDASPALLHSTARVEIRTGRFPLSRRQAFRKKLDDIGALVESAWEDDRHVYAVVLCHRPCRPRVESAMAENAFQPLKLPGMKTPPSRRLAMIEEERLQAEEEIAELRGNYRLLAKEREELLVLRDLLANHLDRLRAEGMMAFTRETLSLEGWVPAGRLPEIREHLLGRFPLISVSASDPGPLDRPPVILENAGAVRPFGLVVDLYGLPRYGSVDPSTVLAAFFALFFGLCLTDAGYGLLLAASAGALLLAAPRPLPAGLARFFSMLFLCALATVAAGAAAGGWFGLKAPWRLFDPLDDLMLFFLLALAVGTAHIFAGLILRMVRVVRGGDILGAVVDQGLWMVLILALFGVAAAGSGYGPDVAPLTVQGVGGPLGPGNRLLPGEVRRRERKRATGSGGTTSSGGGRPLPPAPGCWRRDGRGQAWRPWLSSPSSWPSSGGLSSLFWRESVSGSTPSTGSPGI